MKKIIKRFFTFLLITTPFIASAQINAKFTEDYSEGIIHIINAYLVPVLMAIAFIVFIWGVFKNFIWKGDSGEAHTEGSKFVAWGVIGFVIILSLWALVNIVASTLGLGGYYETEVPYSPTSTNAQPSTLGPPGSGSSMGSNGSEYDENWEYDNNNE